MSYDLKFQIRCSGSPHSSHRPEGGDGVCHIGTGGWGREGVAGAWVASSPAERASS